MSEETKDKHLVVDKNRIGIAIQAMFNSLNGIKGLTYLEIYEAAYSIEKQLYTTFQPITRKLIDEANKEAELNIEAALEEKVEREFKAKAQERMKNSEKPKLELLD